ncbi:MAG: hypothetical protein JWN12_795 [Candidatus Saccharibacteria bacterium]|nr:hypothetical protein [Candidatus Saccharibacteria bacterium]
MAQSLATWPHEIHVIGMGGIGTHVLQMLLEHGTREVHIWDEDIVEAHNLPTQFLYCPLDIGYPKVEAAARFVEERGFKTQIVAHNEWATGESKLSGIVISGVDTLEARGNIWQAVEFNFEVFLYIDARIGADSVQIHTMDPNLPKDVDRYKSWIFLDDEALELGCATRENPHSALAVAQILSSHLALFVRDEPIVGLLERDLLSESEDQAHPQLV